MKNKWPKVTVRILVGFVAIGAAKTMGSSVIGSITTIVGTLLFIVGIVEAFKKQKQQPPAAS